jgi:hypothetical protein
MSHTRHLPIWKTAFDLAVHLEHAVRRFPRYHAAPLGLGTELRQTTQHLCRLLARANDVRDAARGLVWRLPGALSFLSAVRTVF